MTYEFQPCEADVPEPGLTLTERIWAFVDGWDGRKVNPEPESPRSGATTTPRDIVEGRCAYIPEQVCFRPDDLVACGVGTTLYCTKCEADVCEEHSVIENGQRICRDCRGDC